MSLFLRHVVALLVPSLLCVGVSFALNRYTHLVNPFWSYNFLFFAPLCFILNLVFSVSRKSPQFTQILLFGNSVKLLLTFVGIFLLSLMMPKLFYPIAIHFVLYYLVFTIFEVHFMIYLIQLNKPKHDEHA
jgi:hypothetical protein